MQITAYKPTKKSPSVIRGIPLGVKNSSVTALHYSNDLLESMFVKEFGPKLGPVTIDKSNKHQDKAASVLNRIMKTSKNFKVTPLLTEVQLSFFQIDEEKITGKVEKIEAAEDLQPPPPVGSHGEHINWGTHCG